MSVINIDAINPKVVVCISLRDIGTEFRSVSPVAVYRLGPSDAGRALFASRLALLTGGRGVARILE